MDGKTQRALTRVKNAGVNAPDSDILCWIQSVGADIILQASLGEIRSTANCF